jgi:hypothetical protein
VEQHTITTNHGGSSIFSVELLFTLFGMILVLGGLAGGKRVKLVSIEFGPITSIWRRMAMVLIGLIILTCIGLLEMGAY